jgi:DNA topoisomerase III
VRCPNCGASNLKEDYRTYHCETCGYRLFKNIASRELSTEEVTLLVRDRKLGPLEGFRSKTGRLFSAQLVLNEENKPQFAFEQNNGAFSTEIDPVKHTAVGRCQVCGAGQVYDLGPAYVCENVPKQICSFKLSKSILQREILPEQLRKMLTEGRSDLIRGFISKKGRPFDAVLTLEKGKIGWEFAKRETRKRKRKAPAKTKAS